MKKNAILIKKERVLKVAYDFEIFSTKSCSLMVACYFDGTIIKNTRKWRVIYTYKENKKHAFYSLN